VTGVDLSEPALALARQSAAAAGLEVEWLRADMRELPFAEDFDAAINLWSAFGYFEREDEDLRALAAIAGALRRGGALLLDTISFLGLLRRYQPRRFDRYGDGGLLLEEVELDLEAGRSQAHWIFVTGDGRREQRSFSMRLYTLPELRALMERAGLRYERAFGDFEGGAYGLDSQRMIVVARRPAG
jgi:SAM-dependent methyltransferase